jgi:hypothetical protein
LLGSDDAKKDNEQKTEKQNFFNYMHVCGWSTQSCGGACLVVEAVFARTKWAAAQEQRPRRKSTPAASAAKRREKEKNTKNLCFCAGFEIFLFGRPRVFERGEVGRCGAAQVES